jgi:protein-S-isoprenylcysteine O-methyltransferase Ste14
LITDGIYATIRHPQYAGIGIAYRARVPAFLPAWRHRGEA